MSKRFNIMKQLMSLTFIGLTLMINACKTPSPVSTVPPETKISLTSLETAATEAWLDLKTDNLELPATADITADGKQILSFSLHTADTTIYLEGLLPKHNYTFGIKIKNHQGAYSTAAAITTTLDTTGHDIDLKVFTIGDYTSNQLYGVSIIDDSTIWAVGEVYLFDSLGARDPDYYSLVICHNDSITYKHLYDQYNPSSLITMNDIISFGSNDICLGSVFHWDGTRFNQLPVPTPFMGIVQNKIWGISSNDFYDVGYKGKIAHYQNGSWTEVNSHTTQEIHDIWGTPDNKTILCAVSSKAYDGEQKILKITGNQADTINWATGREAYSLWTEKGFPVFVCGAGIFTNKNNSWKEIQGLPMIYTNQIRGTALNNIFVIGDSGLLMHYNGSTWKTYDNFLWTNLTFYSLSVKGKKFAAVGDDGRKAYLIKGELK
jgi:hypothetical protein